LIERMWRTSIWTSTAVPAFQRCRRRNSGAGPVGATDAGREGVLIELVSGQPRPNLNAGLY
jgi:hypothetical protein